MRRESLLMVIRASTSFETAHKPAENAFRCILTGGQGCEDPGAGDIESSPCVWEIVREDASVLIFRWYSQIAGLWFIDLRAL